jgi:hypothetical protein
MKAISSKSISFPKYQWGINAGEVRELPDDKEAQKRILSEPEISEVRGTKENKEK